MDESPPAADAGPVVLELGPGAGAVVAYTGADWIGQEVEIGAVDGTTPRRHAYVRERAVGADRVWAVVLPGLAPGSYRLWAPDGSPLDRVQVRAGTVSEVRVHH